MDYGSAIFNFESIEQLNFFLFVLEAPEIRPTFLSNKKQKKSSTRRQKTKVNTGVNSYMKIVNEVYIKIVSCNYSHII